MPSRTFGLGCAWRRRFPRKLLGETLNVAARCIFNLDELHYQYPEKSCLPARPPRRICAASRTVQLQIEHELDLINDLKYEHYFLTVADIVAFAWSPHILCQGRGVGCEQRRREAT